MLQFDLGRFHPSPLGAFAISQDTCDDCGQAECTQLDNLILRIQRLLKPVTVNRRPLQHRSEQDGFQCGYCTPGQICSAIGMISEFRNGLPSAVTADMASETIDFSDEELSERMSGNLCRCGAYIGIRAAIRQAFESEANQ